MAAVLAHVQERHKGMTLAELRVLLELAHWSDDAPPCHADLTKALGVQQSVLSRTLQGLGDGLPRRGGGGLKLITQWRSPTDHKKRQVRLTESGHALLTSAALVSVSDIQPRFSRAHGEKRRRAATKPNGALVAGTASAT